MLKTKTILLADATKDEMQRFAIEHLGFQRSPNTILEETLRAKIAAAWDKEEITIIVQDEGTHQSVGQSAENAPEAVKTDDEFVTINISKTEEDGGDQPVWASVNGRGMWIPRGEDVRVRKCYEHVLENAVRTVYDQKPAANGQPGEMVPRQAPAYPFRRVS